MRFTKMQGIGNDYIYINLMDETVRDPSGLAVRMSQPHYGVGADGLVLIDRGTSSDFNMRIFNADGSESEMCGNAARCIGKYLYERGLTDKTELTLNTGGGLRVLRLRTEGRRVVSVRVDMGAPLMTPEEIPVLLGGDAAIGVRLEVPPHVYEVTCVSMGNPHCVIFVPDAERTDAERIGPLIERHPAFPRRTNVEFVQVVDRTHLRMRVWERGTGETKACGTGACAALVASVLNGLTEREAEITLPGGMLQVSWEPEDGHVYQEGPAEIVFDGEWPDEA